MTRSLVLATFGRVTDINSSSGTPYFFWRAAQGCGFDLPVVDLPASRDLWMRRALWWLGRLVTINRPWGFVWSNAFLEAAWKAKISQIRDRHLLNYGQLVPISILQLAEAGEIDLSFYIDLSLKELFAEYHDLAHLGKGIRDSAIQRETRGYRVAERVFVVSTRSAETLCTDYEIDNAKVKAIVSGANLDEDIVAAHSQSPPWNGDREFVVGFVGMDYIRKGLLPLAEAVSQLRARGMNVRLKVVGPEPSELKNVDGVDLVGRIDKSTHMESFVDLLAHCDLGALPTSAEGAPASLREFLRLGVPVLATNVAGIPDIVPRGAGLLLNGEVTAEALAVELGKIMSSQTLYAELKNTALNHRDMTKWSYAVRAIMADLGNPVP